LQHLFKRLKELRDFGIGVLLLGELRQLLDDLVKIAGTAAAQTGNGRHCGPHKKEQHLILSLFHTQNG
jgi:hypothetical protein